MKKNKAYTFCPSVVPENEGCYELPGESKKVCTFNEP